jgi:hypothetical protein
MGNLDQPETYDLLMKLWQSTRLCPRCNLVIERSSGCNSFYCICGHHFDFASAPRVVGNGIERFGQVINTARASRLSIEEVMKYGGDDQGAWRMARAVAWNTQVNRTAVETRLSKEEAWQLLQQAKMGDMQAREKIRLARNRGGISNNVEAGEDKDFSFTLWENGTLEVDVDAQVEETNSAAMTIEVSDPVSIEVEVVQENSVLECAKKTKSLAQKLRLHAYTKAVLANNSQVPNQSR